jgi:hypothetical protein
MTDWKQKSAQERYEHVGLIIDTKLETVTRIRECLTLSYNSFGTRYEGQIASLIGPTRFGKTSGAMVVMKELAIDLGAEFVTVKSFSTSRKSVACFDYVELQRDRQITRPVICIGVAPSPTYNGLLCDTIYALTGTMPSSRTPHAKLLDTLVTQLLAQQVRMVIFDEAHRICREGGTAHNKLAADVFTTIAKRARVEIVVIGREELRDLAGSNPEFAEMNELVYEIGPLPYPLGLKDPFAVFLRKFEKNMPFDMDSDFGGLRGAQLFHRYARGAPGPLALLLQLATKYAVLKDLPNVDLTTVGNALKSLKNVKGTKNIFLHPPGTEVMKRWAQEAAVPDWGSGVGA